MITVAKSTCRESLQYDGMILQTNSARAKAPTETLVAFLSELPVHIDILLPETSL
jgi:hypothetical protein